MQSLDWYGLYDRRWVSEILPDSLEHPAKYSRGLIQAIYRHFTEQGWLAKGDHVIDPFGGIALGALDAMTAGLHWTGVELEKHFTEWGLTNIDIWTRRYGPTLGEGWGTARLINGDSRRLLQAITQAQPGPTQDLQAGAVISSPPYADISMKGGTKGLVEHGTGITRGKNSFLGYNRANHDNLGTMPATIAGYKAAIGSPPFVGVGLDHNEGNGVRTGRNTQVVRSNRPAHIAPGQKAGVITYGGTPGQLGNLKESEQGFRAATSSPSTQPARAQDPRQDPGSQDNDFWIASRQILDQVYQVLTPGGHTAWVVKGFVRDGAYIDFPAQWAGLCEAAGFVMVQYIRAWQTRELGTQLDIFGQAHTKRKENKSFFRRMIEKKGGPRVDYEAVLVMVKPKSN